MFENTPSTAVDGRVAGLVGCCGGAPPLPAAPLLLLPGCIVVAEEEDEEGAPPSFSVSLINVYDPEVDCDVEVESGDKDVEGEGDIDEVRVRNGLRIIRRRFCCVCLHRVFTPFLLLLLEGEGRGRCEVDDIRCLRGED
jgi:hypothetical protein